MRGLGRALAVCFIAALVAFIADVLLDARALPVCEETAVACGYAAADETPDHLVAVAAPSVHVPAPSAVVPPPSFLGGAPLSPSHRLVVCRRA